MGAQALAISKPTASVPPPSAQSSGENDSSGLRGFLAWLQAREEHLSRIGLPLASGVPPCLQRNACLLLLLLLKGHLTAQPR